MLTYVLCDNIWSENFLFYHKTCFPRKMRVYYNAVLKDRILFKWDAIMEGFCIFQDSKYASFLHMQALHKVLGMPGYG